MSIFVISGRVNCYWVLPLFMVFLAHLGFPLYVKVKIAKQCQTVENPEAMCTDT